VFKKTFVIVALVLLAMRVAQCQHSTVVPMSSVTGLNDALAQLNSSISNLQAAVSMLTASTRVNGEALAGTMNGVNAQFWLKYVPSQPGSVVIYRNGVRLSAGADYVLSGTIITFATGAIPQAGDSLLADYVTAPQAVPGVSTLTFANQSLYFPPAAQTVTFSNSGPAAAVFSSWTISGTNATSYSITANTCGQSLPAGGTCSVTVAFNPAQVGPLSGTLVANDNAFGSPQVVNLAGTGVLTVPTGWTKIVSALDGSCLDVAGQSVASGSAIITNTCNGSTGQAFQFTAVSGGYQITEENSSLQLDSFGGPANTADNTMVGLWPYWGGTNEIWTTKATTDGFFTVNVSNSGKCLTANGTSVVTTACSGIAAQNWILIPMS
jgi:Ricin-type beta-trefoil lectin domain